MLGDRQSVLSDVPEDDVIQAQAKELLKRAKSLDTARRGYMEESQRIIGKQQDAIEHLKSENRRIKEDLDAETKADSEVPSASEHSRIIQLKELIETFNRKLDIEQRKNEEQSKDIEVTEAKVLNLRKLVGGANGARDNTVQLDRMSSVLDNRLEKAQVKYNQLLSKNKKQREEIDNLRKERVTFENIYKKLETELHDKKGELSSKIEMSNIAYEARDQAVAEMAAIRAKADGEQTEFETEMARLGARLGDGRRNRDAAMRDLLYSSVKSISHLKGQAAAVALESFDDAFECLRICPGGDGEPGKVVDNFLEKEDANLVLFNYVRELKDEVERLEKLRLEKEAEMERVKKQGQLKTDSTGQRKEMVRELEEELHHAVEKRDGIQQKNTDAARTLADLKDTARMIAERVRAEGAPSSVDAVDSSGAPGDELNQWLGVLEQRANESVTMWIAHQRAQDRGHGPPVVATTAPAFSRPSAGAMLKIEAPSISAAGGSSDDESSSGDDEMPLTREQLKTKVIHKTGIAYEEFISESDMSLKSQGGKQRPASALAKLRGVPSGAAPPSSGGSSSSSRRVSSARPGARRPPASGGAPEASAVKVGSGDRKAYTPRSGAASAADDADDSRERRGSSASSRKTGGGHWR